MSKPYSKLKTLLFSVSLTLVFVNQFSLASAHSSPKKSEHAEPMDHGHAKKMSHAKPAKPSSHAKPHWEYSGAHGPQQWSHLSNKFRMCSSGRLQSPFNIHADISAELPELDLDYHAVPLTVINNGHTIQVDQAGAGRLNVGGKSYELLQFHFHSTSEYTINGERYPLELHLVHASESGDLAVVGVMFKQGAENAELANIWAHMPSRKGTNQVAGRLADVNNLLPRDKRYYRFMGSLTTPPCSEGVNWHMMQTPITVSAAQIARFKAIYPMNARPLQHKNARLVVMGK